MTNVIETLRNLGSIDGCKEYGNYDENLETLELLDTWRPKGYTLEKVDSTFEDLGRWSNYETTVYKVTENGEVAYFEYGQEVPATESQDGMDLSYHFHEVEPKEVTVIQYVEKVEESE